MAKTTKEEPKSRAAVIEMDHPEATNEVPPDEPMKDPPGSTIPDTNVVETAGKEELDRQTSRRGAQKEASIGFFARLQKFQGAEWEKLKIYLYRLAPITDRTAGGNPVKFLTIYREAIDEEMVLKEWGSGRYRCLLNQAKEKGEAIPIDRVEFEIENINFPPKVPPGEWVDDPRNRRWAWANPNKDQSHQQQANGTTVIEAKPTPIKELVDGVERLQRLASPAAPPPVAAPDPVAQIKGTVDAMKGMAEMMKPPAPAAPDNTLQTFLLAELTAERSTNRELMGKLLDRANAPAAAPPADPLRDLAMKMLEKRLEKMDEKPEAESAAERVSRMNGTQELIVELTKAVSPVLEKAMGLFTVMAASKQPPPAARPRPPATVDVAPTGTPTAEQPPQQTQEQPPQQPETPQPTMEQAQQQILNYVLGTATPTLQQYLDTSDGDSFATWFCDTTFSLPGVPPPFNRLSGVDALKFAKQTGKPAIIEAYKKAPALWQQIAPNSEAEEKFIRFLDEFLAYDPEAEAEEDDEKD